jgi:hypothetical protein
MLDGREQLAQLTIWIGRFRRLQAYELPNLSEEERAALQRIFPKLVGISKQYEPGYIEAFRQSYETNWDDYVARAEEALKSATEVARQRREVEARRAQQTAASADRQQASRTDADAALEGLKSVLTRFDLPGDETGHLPFYEALDRVIAARGISEPSLVEMLLPYRDLLTGSAYRSLRKHLDRLRQQDDRQDDSLQAEYQELLAFSRGKHAVMIGGSAREDARRSLERVFAFEDLDWEDHESNRPALLDSIESRIRNGGVDLVLILKSFVGHNVTERLRPACEKAGIPCLLVDKGYGPSQIAEVLRRGITRLN